MVVRLSNEYDFEDRLIGIRRTSEIYLDCIFIHAPHYTIHGIEHSLALEKYMDDFLNNNKLYLNEYEIFLLKSSIWLHDIGMMIREDHKEELESIRKNHHKRSQDFIDSDDGRNIFNLNIFESNIIGTLSYLHRKSVNIKLTEVWYKNSKIKLSYPKLDSTPANFNIQIDKLAMLLRLLDTCDRNHLRSFDPNVLKLAKIPDAAKYHWAHHLINSVEFEKNKIIINSYVPPLIENACSKEENIINYLVINDIKREIDSLEWALRKYNLHCINVEHKPNRNGTITFPEDVYEDAINYLERKKEVSGYSLRSINKNAYIFENGNTIIDLISDLVVIEEDGITEVSHVFSADESSPPNFKFKNFGIIKEVSITQRFNKQSIFAYVLNSYKKEIPTIDLQEEIEIIVDPFKRREFILKFSPKLAKDTRIKYGVGFSAPKFFILDDPNKYLYSNHFIRVPTNNYKISLQFEKGLIVNELNFKICDINNQTIVEKKLDISKENVQSEIIYDGFEGECIYSRENGLYYDIHSLNTNSPKIYRYIKTKFKVGNNMDRTA